MPCELPPPLQLCPAQPDNFSHLLPLAAKLGALGLRERAHLTESLVALSWSYRVTDAAVPTASPWLLVTFERSRGLVSSLFPVPRLSLPPQTDLDAGNQGEAGAGGKELWVQHLPEPLQ